MVATGEEAVSLEQLKMLPIGGGETTFEYVTLKNGSEYPLGDSGWSLIASYGHTVGVAYSESFVCLLSLEVSWRVSSGNALLGVRADKAMTPIYGDTVLALYLEGSTCSPFTLKAVGTATDTLSVQPSRQVDVGDVLSFIGYALTK